MSKFAQRAIITVTLGPLALYFIYLGGLFYAVPLAIVLAFAAVEFAQMTRNLGWQTSAWILVPLVLVFFVVGWWREWNLFGPVILVALLVVMAHALWLYEIKKDGSAPATWMAMMGGIMLIGWLGSHFFSLRSIDIMAWQWTMLAMASTWIADSAAYLVGKFLAGNILGKHHLSPRLSPNKTIEGYAGGVIMGTALTVLLAMLLQLPLIQALILGLLITIISPLGDLGISLLKREAGVKDSGTIFGGHGGALDRVDSLVWSVTIAYYLVAFFQVI
ncbi:MAG: phosphatidate cytidylyltransferase [Anaerolineaceae bacterium]|nr:MAG: phosphatidate cytidylyltransferase [Anaerolineaceae bacterium]